MHTDNKSAATVIGIGSTSLFAAAFGGATSADAQTTGAANWSGVYFGLSGGFVGMSTRMNDSAVATGLGAFGYGAAPVPGIGTNAKIGGNGGTIGLHGGYNFQVGRIVLGVEGDISWVNAKADGTGVLRSTGTAYGYGGNRSFGTSTFRSKVDSLATIRGRLGFDLDGSTMVFASAGFAAAQVKNNWSGQMTDAFGTAFSGA